MSSPKGFILYRIWYGNCLAYVGRTKNHYKLGLEDICLRNQCIER